MLNRFIFLAVLCLLGTAAAAQQGVIAGTVYDEDGFPMLGANVVIEGTTTGAQTDFIEGKYQFKADPGTYTLVVSYVGYADKKIEAVEVSANETTLIDVNFDGDTGVELELDVTVTAKALERGEVAVLKLRQNSDKVQDIMSSQEIQRIGANNAGDALKKVTGTTVVDGKYVYVRGLGDRYSATTVNGLRLPSIDPYRNSAQLDLIPTNLLDNIVASKTFTPDLPGDFTGGSVNVKLKSLPERFTWGISLGTTYNPQNNFRDDFLTFDAGDRAGLGFADATLERPALFSETERIDELGAFDNSDGRQARRDDALAAIQEEATDAIGPGFINDQIQNTPIDYNFGANIGTQIKVGEMPVGVFATLTYRRSFNQYQDGIKGNYENGGQAFDRLIRLFSMEDDRSVENTSLGGMFGLNFRPSSANNISFYTIYSHQGSQERRSLRGAYDQFGVVGNEESFFQSSNTSFQSRDLQDYVLEGQHTLTGLNNVKIEWAANYVRTEQLEPGLTQLGYISELRNGEPFAQINESNFALPTRFDRDLNDDTYQGKLDITIPILQNKSRGNSVKFGGLYNTKERRFTQFSSVFANRNGEVLGNVNADLSQYFADDNMGIIGGESGSNVIGLFVRDESLLSDSYNGTSDIAAGYGMLTYELTPKLKVIAGARLETTNIYVESDFVQAEIAAAAEAEREVNQIQIDRNIGEIDTTAILPAVNLVYKVRENSNLRASFTQTIARPNMREIAPFRATSFAGEVPVFGNPELGLTSIDNYDLRYEIFPEGGEVLAISAFYKQFRDPIVTTFRRAGSQQFTWTNSDRATLYGVELEIRKKLSFLSEKLQNFTISGNMALIESEQDVDPRIVEEALPIDPDFSATRTFSGQSPFVANLNLSYTNVDAGWDGVIAYNYFGKRLNSIGAVGAPDIFEQGRSQLDISMSKKINNLRISVRARNLIDPEYKFFSEFKGTEDIFGLFRRGRDFSLSIGYSL
ncbi:MAG: TonB-dependent receptor [Bacteroidota bacterium]